MSVFNQCMLFNAKTNTTLTTGLAHYWKFDTNSVASYGGLTGLDTNITYNSAYGKISGGALFNGTNSQIRAASTQAIFTNSTTARSLTCWSYPTESRYGSIFRTSRQGELGSLTVSAGAGVVYFYFLLKMNTGYQQFYTNAVAINNWYNFTIVLDLPNRKCYTYVNGEYSRYPGYSDDLVGTTIATATTSSYIGANMSGSAEYYKGNIDELGLWNKALTVDEVKELYWSGVGNTYPFTP